MLIENQKAEMKWHNSTRKRYTALGYQYTQNGDTFLVNVSELTPSSRATIEVICDYCNNSYFPSYKNYLKSRNTDIKEGIEPKDCCKVCRPKKSKETNLRKYGVESYTQTEEFKDKARKTNLRKYGVENYTQTEEFKDKARKTNLDKYGFESYTQTEEYKKRVKKTNLQKYGHEHWAKAEIVIEKRKKTMIDRYGVENTSQLDETKEKKRATTLKNYGVEVPAQSQKVLNKMKKTLKINYGVENAMHSPKVVTKLRESLFHGQNVKTSKQQLLIHNLVGGILNLPHHTSNLDIAFEDEKIYIEYNGGGHRLRVKFGHFTDEEFNQIERDRWYALNRKGWKQIRIESKKDLLPSNIEIIKMINYAKELLKERSWVEFNIDEGYVETSKFKTDYNFGKLRYVKNVNID